MERGERDASKVEQAIRKEGRRKLYRDGTGYRTSVDDDGKLIPFSDWCIEHVGYSSLRCGMTKSECPDGPRYKAIGNSMAVPVMRFIGERIAMAEAGEIA